MTQKTEDGGARELLERIYELRRNAVSVSPRWLATEAMLTLDPNHISHPLEYLLAHLQLRQIARAICANRWDGQDDSDEQSEMFPELQNRYPIERTANEDPEYRLLEYLTERDIAWNVARLRSEALAKLNHADRLEAWGRSRKRAA